MPNSNDAKLALLHHEVLVELLTKEQSEGIGARVRQSIGTLTMKHFTLFLVLDHFKLNPESGFPDHPDRGQETISYLFKGRADHKDFTGLKCTLEPGDLQFMTAGRGIMNPEFPKIDQEKDGSITYVEGLQLWVDLPAKLRTLGFQLLAQMKKSQSRLFLVNLMTLTLKDFAYIPLWMLDFVVLPGER